jgi:hypothetical protein
VANSSPSRSELARFALMCAAAEEAGPLSAYDGSGAPLPLPSPPAWMLAGQRLAGWVTALDVLFHVGPIVIDSRRCLYGWVLENDDGSTVIIRGTANIIEWIEDGDGVAIDFSGAGKVERGFCNLTQSLWFRPVEGPEQTLLASLLNAKSVTVAGHSLGAAMASIFSLELAERGIPVKGRYFESPRPGDATFAHTFDAQVNDYMVVRYEPDLVPDLPPLGFSPLSNVLGLPANPAICDNPLCNHHAINIAWLLDPTSTAIVAGCAT